MTQLSIRFRYVFLILLIIFVMEYAGLRGVYRQGKPNTGFIVVYLSANLPIVCLNQLFDNGQADTRSAMFP